MRRRGRELYTLIPDIFIAPLQVLYCSEALPTTALILCRSLTPKRNRQLREKDCPRSLCGGLVVKVEFEPAAFRMQGTKPVTELSRPTSVAPQATYFWRTQGLAESFSCIGFPVTFLYTLSVQVLRECSILCLTLDNLH